MILPKKRKIELVQQHSVSTNSILGHALVNQINIVETSCHYYVIGRNQVQSHNVIILNKKAMFSFYKCNIANLSKQ